MELYDRAIHKVIAQVISQVASFVGNKNTKKTDSDLAILKLFSSKHPDVAKVHILYLSKSKNT